MDEEKGLPTGEPPVTAEESGFIMLSDGTKVPSGIIEKLRNIQLVNRYEGLSEVLLTKMASECNVDVERLKEAVDAPGKPKKISAKMLNEAAKKLGAYIYGKDAELMPEVIDMLTKIVAAKARRHQALDDFGRFLGEERAKFKTFTNGLAGELARPDRKVSLTIPGSEGSELSIEDIFAELRLSRKRGENLELQMTIEADDETARQTIIAEIKSMLPLEIRDEIIIS